MRTEMKASSECLYPTDVFLISCGMGCKRITVSDIAYIKAMKDNCIIHVQWQMIISYNTVMCVEIHLGKVSQNTSSDIYNK